MGTLLSGVKQSSVVTSLHHAADCRVKILHADTQAKSERKAQAAFPRSSTGR
eukprot:CAMPEP_0119102572 /NCGR_PEP_ID=MMETSP1180-20130426/1278_1 /TAXON_ID=3052 ORGANISM="Chlamydomonas cf sp, Strain CCMP681" /NCGR_SAMPLE_ID=MMETSP1180 /ASSEMBLY_ACC=CAM_ASM_000741 /LENGTH=51 /DNA_ID=CAMNT_0007086885 /DNA_START=763 /DNA_END=918 /DNA_ORIENTATION=+